MKAIGALLIGLNSMIAGCASNVSHVGRTAEARVGGPMLNFTFVDNTGRTTDLRQQVGDFTVLLFTQCETDLHGKASEQLEKLVGEAQVAGYVTTVGFDIHWSNGGCSHGDRCHLLSGDSRLFSLCDARGAVKHLYGASNTREVFILGIDNMIVGHYVDPDFEALSAHLKSLVYNREQEIRSRTNEG